MPSSKIGLFQSSRFTLFSIALAMTIAVIALAGWILHLEILTTLAFPGPGMKLNTAIGILFSGISLLLFNFPGKIHWAFLFAVLVLFIGAVSLSEYLFNWDAGIDELFFRDRKLAAYGHPGRMSPITAIVFILLGISLLTYTLKKTIGLRISEFAAIAALLIAFVNLIGYLYGSSNLYQVAPYTSIAVVTAIAFLLFALSIISSKPDKGFIAAFNKKTNAARIGTRDVLLLIIITVLAGWLRLKLQDAGLFDTQFGESVMIIIFAITFFFVTWLGTKRLNRLELERKKAEEEILNNERRFRHAIGIIGDNVWEHYFTTGKTHFANTINDLLGYPNSELSDNVNLWWGSTHPDDRWMLEECDRNYRAGAISNHHIEYRIYHKNGSLKWVLDRGAVIEKDDEGVPLTIIGTHTDITSRRENELSLKQANENLEKRTAELTASNKELEQFAYVASHDLQEPIRMIGSFMQLLKKKYNNQLDETADKYINIAVDGAERMKTLINDLLSFSRVGTDKEAFSAVDVNVSLKNVLSFFQQQIKESGVALRVGNLPLITGNASQIEQLFQNLIGNAIKYCNKEAPYIEISCQEDEREWEFYIKDNGIGFDNNYAEKVFVIFQRLHTKQEYSGTGIGLAICKKIVERHGGQIGVNSVSGKGSTFYFTISKKN